MTSLQKAKAFLKKAALNIVPLAFVAINVHAATFIPSAATCSGSSGGIGFLALPDSNGVTGVKFFTTSDCIASGPGNGLTMTVTASGGPGGSFPIDLVSIPVHADFTVTDPTFLFSLQFSYTLQINGQAAQGLTDFSINSGEPVSVDFDYIIDTPGMSLDSWTLLLSITSTNDGSPETMTLTIPQNSLDINVPQPAADTPEPSSLLMLAGGGAFLAVLRRKNNHQ